MDRIRVASLQYFIRPVRSFREFTDQVEGLVATAADYKCRLLVFPEYFTLQLLTLGEIHRPIQEQIRDLANQREAVWGFLSAQSQKYRIYLAGGTIPHFEPSSENVYNDCAFFGPSGRYGVQGKLHMTRFEKEEWLVSPRNGLCLFETDFGMVAISICYDVEFPLVVREAAQRGAKILIVPSCTDDRQGFLRVRYCAQARAIENQMYVIHSSTVGSLPMVPAVSLNYGQASILCPSDFPFSRDGIISEGIANQETMILGDLNMQNLEEVQCNGTVLPVRDGQRTRELISNVEKVSIG